MTQREPRRRREGALTDPMIGVLLTAVGGPASLDEVAPFLRDIRRGRPTPDSLIDEFRERYRRIGGKSPLLEITRAQADALERRLTGEGLGCRCFVGMRNWHPYIRDAIREMSDQPIDRIVVLPMTPYRSARSIGTYVQAVKEAVASAGRPFEVAYVESWNTEPGLLEAFAAKVSAGLRRMAAKGFRDPLVLFTAHSLPRKLIEDGDPYERELRETMAAILGRLPPIRSQMAWQSAGRTSEPWLGPSLEETVERVAKAGEKSLLVVPFGFLSDNLEILYDIDMEAREQAEPLGIHLERTESLNTDPRLIEAMASAFHAKGRAHVSTPAGSAPRR